jgi:hypothetical protein
MKKIFLASSVLASITGIVMIVGGVWGICFTYQNVVREKIVTPADASIPSAKVAGPLTLKSQADIIRHHTLATTGDKTYAEMPRQIEKVDASGQKTMVENTARNLWVTATTLTTALNLGIVTYVFSALVILLGLISIWNGIVFCMMYKKFNSFSSSI